MRPIRVKWDAETIARLKSLQASGASLQRAAVALKTSTIMVRNKAREYGCPFPDQKEIRRQHRQREDQAREEAGLPALYRR